MASPIGSRAAALALSACLTGGLLAAMLSLGVGRRVIRPETLMTVELLPLPPLVPPVVPPPSAAPRTVQPKVPLVPPPIPVAPVPIVKVERPLPRLLVHTAVSAAPVPVPSVAAVQSGGPASNGIGSRAAGVVQDTPVLTPPDAAAFSRDNAAPVYPESARRRRQQGVVVISVSVSADGQVTALRVRDSSGFPVLDEAALEAVRHWRFAPATRGGVPIAAQGYVELPFVLRRR